MFYKHFLDLLYKYLSMALAAHTFITNNRGGHTLVINNYKYRNNKKIGNDIYWKCCDPKCNLTAKTNGHNLLAYTPIILHDHPDNAQEIKQQTFVASVKNKIRSNPNTSVKRAYEEVLEQENDEEVAYLPNFEAIQSTAYRVKEKVRSQLPRFFEDLSPSNGTIDGKLDGANLSTIARPIIFKNKIADWEASTWTPQYLEIIFGNKLLNFRVGNKHSHFESECDYINGTLKDFNDWSRGDTNLDSEFSRYSNKDSWCYFDYKYMAELFEDQSQILDSVNWSNFGYSDRNGDESTIWIGSCGATTACHQDAYGFNLVAQIYGHKRWVLFSPNDTQYLYTTRIPYEESSIYSRVNISMPDLKTFPLFQKTSPYVVVLEPGDVLLVPHKWWHHVQSLDTTISINTWVEIQSDDISRLKESITRTLLFPVMTQYYDSCAEKTDDFYNNSWLNPNETNTNINENFQLLQNALHVCRKSFNKKRRKNFDLNIESPITKLQRYIISSQKTDYQELCIENNNLKSINGDQVSGKGTNIDYSINSKQTATNCIDANVNSNPMVSKSINQTINSNLTGTNCIDTNMNSNPTKTNSIDANINLKLENEDAEISSKLDEDCGKDGDETNERFKDEIEEENSNLINGNLLTNNHPKNLYIASVEMLTDVNKINFNVNEQDSSTDVDVRTDELLSIDVAQVEFEEYLRIMSGDEVPPSLTEQNFKLKEFNFNDFIDALTDEDVIKLIAKKMLNKL